MEAYTPILKLFVVLDNLRTCQHTKFCIQRHPERVKHVKHKHIL